MQYNHSCWLDVVVASLKNLDRKPWQREVDIFQCGFDLYFEAFNSKVLIAKNI